MPYLSGDPFDIAGEAIDTGNLQILQELRTLILNGMVDVNTWCDEVTLLGMVAEAGDLALVETMIERGADVNLKTDVDVSTPLMQAVSGGNLEIVKCLVNAGADVNEVKSGDFALACAIYGDHQAIANYLYPLTSLDLRQRAEQVELTTTKTTLQEGLDVLEIELFEAITIGDLDRVVQLINLDANINALNEQGDTPLSYSAALVKFDIVRILISAGANPNLVSGIKSPAILIAAGYGDVEIVKMLIETGADVNTSIEHRTALMQAAQWAPLGEAKQIIGELIKAGVNLETQDKYGNTALILAAEQNRTSIVEILRQAGASDTQLSGLLLLNASDNGDKEQVQSLIRSGVDIDARSSNGYTAVSCAASRGYAEILAVLIEMGADINVKDDRGFTPLMLAVDKGHVPIIQMLIQIGADVSAKDYVNRSVINHAQEAHLKKNIRREILQLLKENGATH
jgi:uncharacterized protein